MARGSGGIARLYFAERVSGYRQLPGIDAEPVGERNDEAVRCSKNVHRSAVHVPRFPTHMRENAEARYPASEQPSDRVSEGNVDLRQPSLTEPHHEHARGGDGDDYDGCGIHGLMKSDALAFIPRWRTACRIGGPELV